jgi:GDSL-like Lipase/Acylhydrolase family
VYQHPAQNRDHKPTNMNTSNRSFLRRPFRIVSALAFAWSLAYTQAQESAPRRFWDPVLPSPSTTIPGQVNDAYWRSEYERVNKAVAEANGSQVVFFGDSITLCWSMANADGKAAWENRLAKYKPINMGNSGDITPVMLYRITKGNLDFAEGQSPCVAVLLCGTNNYVVKQSDGGKEKWDLGIDAPPGEVADGVRAIAQVFRRKLPATRVIVLGILPVKDKMKWGKCRETNRILASYDYPKDEIVFMDLEDRFLNGDGSINPELFKDGTHLTSAGYEVLADALVPQIERLIGMGPAKSTN